MKIKGHQEEKETPWISYPVFVALDCELEMISNQHPLQLPSRLPSTCAETGKLEKQISPHSSKTSGIRIHQIEATAGELEGGREVRTITLLFFCLLLTSRIRGGEILGFTAKQSQRPVSRFVRLLWGALEFHSSTAAARLPQLPEQVAAKFSGQFSIFRSHLWRPSIALTTPNLLIRTKFYLNLFLKEQNGFCFLKWNSPLPKALQNCSDKRVKPKMNPVHREGPFGYKW